MPGSTPSRSSRNSHASVVPMSERQQLKLVRQLEVSDNQGAGNSGCSKDTGNLRTRSRSCNGRGETPLHKAAIKGDEELVNKLLEEGADPNIPDFAGWTPLHEACNHGWYKVALALIEAGASVNARGLDDDTPLHDAAVNGHAKLVRLLVGRGADVNSRNKGGKTPCDVAAPGLVPHLLRFNPFESRGGMNASSERAHENDSTAISETLETTPQTKGEETSIPNTSWMLNSDEGGRKVFRNAERIVESLNPTTPNGISFEKSPKFTLKLHQVRKKSILEETIFNKSRIQLSNNMDEKSNKEDIYEFKSSKEATPVRGTSASPEADKNNSESKNEKSGDSATEAEQTSMKRTLTEAGEGEETEDEIKKKKRKESEPKVREETGSSKSLNSAGRGVAARNVSGGSEKGGKGAGHVLCKNSGGSKTVLSNLGVGANSDRKSPGSPKGGSTSVQHGNSNAPSSGVVKTESEAEEKSVAEGEKVDQGPKVPPLKIVIPQQTASEPEQGNRNGKNGASRHHQALPYVVSSNSNDGEKEGLRSRSASPTDSFKADEKKDPAIGMLSAEDQKGTLHHQRVLRSAHRSGPNNNGESRSLDASGSRTGTAGGTGSTSGGNNTAATNPSSNANSGGSVASTEDPSPRSQNASSPSPQVDSNKSALATSTPASGEGGGAAQNFSNCRANSSTPNKTNGTSSSSGSTTNYEDKSTENNSESSQTPSQSTGSNPAPVELHPRKRKLKHNKELKEPPLPQVATERCESATTSTEVHPHEQPVKNCYQLFLDIRKQIERRRKGLFPVQPKPPQGFKDYLMNRCTYVLAGNASTRQIPTSPLPQNLSSPMKDLFSEQEKERHRLRLQHVIEKEKLVLSVEQEILRVHGRAARALANQSLPFSACTILKDEEVYNLITPEQEEKDRNARSRYNGRLFLSWLQDVDDKWEKIKEAMLLRHHNEAESLHAVQKMDWEWKMKELGSCEFKSKPVILDNHVPMVHVSDDFDLLPA